MGQNLRPGFGLSKRLSRACLGCRLCVHLHADLIDGLGQHLHVSPRARYGLSDLGTSQRSGFQFDLQIVDRASNNLSSCLGPGDRLSVGLSPGPSLDLNAEAIQRLSQDADLSFSFGDRLCRRNVVIRTLGI
ncbi:MAG: hypothetical protein ACT4PY_11080 [Armatimonadota bacterium]